MAELFISHSTADAEAARELRRQLEAGGYSCWMAPDDVSMDRPWAVQILDAIEASRVMIVLVSDDANRSDHVSKEVGLALERRKAVLPVRVEDVLLSGSLAYLLHLVQWIDAFPGPIGGYADKVKKQLAHVIGAGTPPPPPPHVEPPPPPAPLPVAAPRVVPVGAARPFLRPGALSTRGRLAGAGLLAATFAVVGAVGAASLWGFGSTSGSPAPTGGVLPTAATPSAAAEGPTTLPTRGPVTTASVDPGPSDGNAVTSPTPSASVTASPSPRPTPKPTPRPTPRPTPVPDTKGPTVASFGARGGKTIGGLKTFNTLKVSFTTKSNADPSGISGMRMASSTTNLPKASLRKYTSTASYTFSGTSSGQRTVCLQFRDGSPRRNWGAAKCIKVYYDAKPVAQNDTWSASSLQQALSAHCFVDLPIFDNDRDTGRKFEDGATFRTVTGSYQAQHGYLTLTKVDGRWMMRYQPAQVYGYAFDDWFDYTITDAYGSKDTARVTLHVPQYSC